MIFNNNTVHLTESQKHLQIVLGSRLNFNKHLEKIFKKVSKTIGLLWKLHNLLAAESSIALYKSLQGHAWTMLISFMTKPIMLLLIAIRFDAI